MNEFGSGSPASITSASVTVSVMFISTLLALAFNRIALKAISSMSTQVTLAAPDSAAAIPTAPDPEQ